MALGPSFAQENGICICKYCNIKFDVAEVINGKLIFPEEGFCPKCKHPWIKDYKPQTLDSNNIIKSQLNNLTKELQAELNKEGLQAINDELKTLNNTVKDLTKSLKFMNENMERLVKIVSEEIDVFKTNRQIRKDW